MKAPGNRLLVSANYWPIHRSSTGQVSANYRRSVGQVSAKCLRGIGDLKAISADIHIDRLSTDYRPTIHRVSTECRSTVDRVSTATSTDIAVHIAVDSTYSKHDPIFLSAHGHGNAYVSFSPFAYKVIKRKSFFQNSFSFDKKLHKQKFSFQN